MTNRQYLAIIMLGIGTFVGVVAGMLLGLPHPSRVLLGAGLGVLAYFHTIHRVRR